MKRLLEKHLLNIVFLILIAGAALTIYLLSRASTPAAAQANQTAAPAVEAAETEDGEPTDAPAERARGVPEDVFVSHLQTSELFTAAETGAGSWVLTIPGEPAQTALLSYTLDGGSVSSLTLEFTLFSGQNGSGDSAIEQYLEEHGAALFDAQKDTLFLLLEDLFPAADRSDALTRASMRLFGESAAALGQSDRLETEESGCDLIAYRSGDTGGTLTCIVFFDS